jgi:16S rRNA processing protein RimM
MKTQGRHGEVAVEVHSSFPGRFQPGIELLALQQDGSRKALKLEEVWTHKESLILKFADVNSISDAEALVGCELQVPLKERIALEAGWSYVSDLVQCRVYDGIREIGTVQDVRFGAGEAPLLVVKAAGTEYEIPYAAAYLKGIDIGHKRIVMELPEGMLEVNAPLTEEEKKSQRGT